MRTKSVNGIPELARTQDMYGESFWDRSDHDVVDNQTQRYGGHQKYAKKTNVSTSVPFCPFSH
jgi:hypothetical protein